MDDLSNGRLRVPFSTDHGGCKDVPTVLDHLRPTVVVRRPAPRVASSGASALAPTPAARPTTPPRADRAELREPPAAAPASPAVDGPAVTPEPSPLRPPLSVGPQIVVSELASRMGRAPAEIAAELVTRGYFEVTPRAVIARAAARLLAEALGFEVHEVDDAPEGAAPKPAPPPKRVASKRAAPERAASKRAASTGPRTKASRAGAPKKRAMRASAASQRSPRSGATKR
jgi:hypothetical protein